MLKDVIVPIATTLIAVMSLFVAIFTVRTTMRHQRNSVRPILQFRRKWNRSEKFAGLGLVNHGLGPAIIKRSVFYLDGRLMGEWNEETVDTWRFELSRVPFLSTVEAGKALPARYDQFLFYLEEYDVNVDQWFWDIIRNRLNVEIYYSSLYDNEIFKVSTRGMSF